ncbi:transporter substrate-binding domain-containing protein [Mangrovihabitans endophyticus]|uniref:Solute-binding protein family 3/N-terminal domain-containing protein n=1 Tax=Mangrovihabitans endophyticus TaxID=1751298 RepID=A0A8J3BZ60_9ACTN|nr:transporter substrate-binding domain-containing protein [Mangrovihabitans endophyticus]GGK84951.1 hypothetical protein GCM10012284_19050 [Mangrovihabitans endophyticus]
MNPNAGSDGLTRRRPWPVRRRSASSPEDIADRDIHDRDIREREVADRETADTTPSRPEPPRLEPPRLEPSHLEPSRLDPEPPRRLDIAAVRLGALGLALVLALSLATVRLLVGGPPSVAELRAQSGVDTWPVLPIGVKDDQPGVAYRYPDGHWAGFDIQIAYMIAEDLGFRRDEIRFYGMESEDRARMQATDADGNRVPVKLVIASYSITTDREDMAGVTFSAPYLYTEQSVLTRPDHTAVSALEDLRGQDVCTLSTATSETAPMRAGAIVHRRNLMHECIDDLRAKRVDAVSTDAAILAGYKARDPDAFAHWDLGLDTTEAWGVNVGENEALKTLVDLTLYRSLVDPADDRWEQAYQENLQSEAPANKGTPIAVAQQPDVAKPKVREQPWEDNLP